MRDAWIGSNVTRLERASSAALMKRPSSPVAPAGVVALVMMIAVLPLATLSGCRPRQGAAGPYEQQRTMFGTLVTIKVDETATPRVKNAVARAFAEMARVEKLTNNYDPNSAISRLNAQKTTWRKAPTELWQISGVCLNIARATGDYFDPTIWPVTKLWGFGLQERVPATPELRRALSLVGTGRVETTLTPGTRRVSEVVGLAPGMGLDLGGAAKGYAVSRAVAVLEAAGIHHGLVTTGSTTGVFGGKRDGSAWKVGIENPRSPDKTIGTISLGTGAISTSGDYQNYFMHKGVRYHHILEPWTGLPARRAVAATVIVPMPPGSRWRRTQCQGVVPDAATTSDIWSTAIFVMGLDKAVEKFGLADSPVGVVFVTPDRRVRTAGNLKGIVSGLPTRI